MRSQRPEVVLEGCSRNPPDEHGCPQHRCGRCGALDLAGTFAFTHDRGWGGCYTDTEPTLGTGKTIHQVGLSAYRHDNQHYPPCARPGCGHARGVHQSVPPAAPEDSRCYEYCGCRGYDSPVESGGREEADDAPRLTTPAPAPAPRASRSAHSDRLPQ